MIPRTFPSTRAANGEFQMVVYFLGSVTGLQRWVDYIPVRWANEATGKENNYDQNGYINVISISELNSNTTPFKDYVPVFVDNSCADAWTTNVTGYIPVGQPSFIRNVLFAAGEQGVWYDPSDLTTLFQDSAGTTPVTAVEQPVGLMLDKSKGLVLGSEVIPQPLDFTSASWATVGTLSAVTSNSFTNTSGAGAGKSINVTTNKRYSVSVAYTKSESGTTFGIYDASSANLIATSTAASGTLTANYLATGPFYLRLSGNSTVTITSISVRELPGNHAFQSTSAARPVLSARVNLLTNTETLATQSVTTNATTQRLSFTGTGSITLSGTATGTYSAGTHSITTTVGTLTLTVSGTVTKADLRASNDGVGLPVYQRVNTSTDYDTAGFPLYIKPNGSSQFMVTNAIDFSATDKMTVVSGVRKLSDAGDGQLIEFSSSTGSNNGVFRITAPSAAATPGYYWLSKGSIAAAVNITSGYSAPITNVLSGVGDISGDQAILRVNGTQAASSTADQGTGNYGTYPLYLFARGGTTLWYGGRMYGMIVRGAQSSAAQISAAETWMNNKTKAY